MSQLREIAAPFVADPATGVCIRTRLKGLTAEDEEVLRQVGTHLGRLASADLSARVRTGLGHDKDAWADRKRDLTAESTARWAGSITKATHDQWALARRAQAAHIRSLTDGIATVRHRLGQELGAKGTGGMPGGYRSRSEWFQKTRRLAVLEQRLARVQADRTAGHVSVVRGGRRLLPTGHHLGESLLQRGGLLHHAGDDLHSRHHDDGHKDHIRHSQRRRAGTGAASRQKPVEQIHQMHH